MHSNPEPINPVARKVAIISVSRTIEGGAEVVLRNLLNEWSGPLRLVLIAPSGCELDEVAMQRGVEWIDFPAKKDAFLPNWIAMAKLLRTLEVDLVHAWTRRSFDLAAISGWWLGCPSSATLHDHPDAYFISFFRKMLMNFSARRIDPMVCVSRYLESKLVGRGLGGHSVVIPNGVPDFGAEIMSGRTENDEVRIGFAAMHHASKGFPTIASWIRELLASGENVHFDLYGELLPKWAPEVERLQARFPHRIDLHGRVPTAEIFRQIDIFVQASHPFIETFGMVLAEAACAGIPAVSSSFGAEVEVIQDGESGFLFPPGRPELGLDHLRKLVGNQKLREQIGKNARKVFEERFRAVTMIKAYQEVWMRKINGSRQQTSL